MVHCPWVFPFCTCLQKNCFGKKNKAVFLWGKLKKRDSFDDKILKRLNFLLEFVLVEHKIILYLYNVIHTR